MDTLALILTALQAQTGSTDHRIPVNDAAKDSYASLKKLIQYKLAGKRGAEIALTEYGTDPQTWEAPLRKALVQAHADEDKNIVHAAQEVIRLVQSDNAATGKYNGQSNGSTQGFAQGDNLNVNTLLWR